MSREQPARDSHKRNRSRDGVRHIFRLKYVTLRENEAAENVPDPLVLREIYGHPVNGTAQTSRIR